MNAIKVSLLRFETDSERSFVRVIFQNLSLDMDYQKWSVEKLNEIYQIATDPERVKEFVDSHGKAALVGLFVTAYVLKRQRTKKEFSTLKGQNLKFRKFLQ